MVDSELTQRRICLYRVLLDLDTSVSERDGFRVFNGYSNRSFESRLVIQKTIYLLDRLGLDLGYAFSWYLHGPYSKNLAEDLYVVASGDSVPRFIIDEANSINVSERYSEIIETFKRKIETNALWFKDNPRNLELLGSLAFLFDYAEHHTPQGSISDEIVSGLLKEYKPDYSDGLINEAFSTLRANGLIPR